MLASAGVEMSVAKLISRSFFQDFLKGSHIESCHEQHGFWFWQAASPSGTGAPSGPRPAQTAWVHCAAGRQSRHSGIYRVENITRLAMRLGALRAGQGSNCVREIQRVAQKSRV